MKRVAFYTGKSQTTNEDPPAVPWSISYLTEEFNTDFFTDHDDLIDAVGSKNYNAICISSIVMGLPWLLELAVRLKRKDSRVPIVLIVQDVAGLSSKIVEHLAVDVAVERPGNNLVPILQILERSKKKTCVPFSDDDIRKKLSKEKKKFTAYGPRAAISEANMAFLNAKASFLSPITKKQEKELLSATFKRKIDNKEIQVPLSGFSFKCYSGKKHSVKEATGWSKSKLTKYFNPEWGITFREFAENVQHYKSQNELNNDFKMNWDLITGDVLSLYSGVGCWGKCIFCPSKGPMLKLSVETVANALEEAVSHNIKKVAFWDDLFFQDEKWVLDLLNEIKSCHLLGKIDFIHSETRVDTLKRSLIPALARSGFSRISVGMETMLPEKAEYLGKTTNGDKYIASGKSLIEEMLKYGITPVLYFIVSTPASDLDEIATDLLEIAKFMNYLKSNYGKLPEIAMNNCLIPIPGTKIVSEQKDVIYGDLLLSPKKAIKYPFDFKFKPLVKEFIDSMFGEELSFIMENGSSLEYSHDYFKVAGKVLIEIAQNNALEDSGFAEKCVELSSL